MSISAARATHGLIATFTAEAPSVNWSEKIGSVPEGVSLPGATHGYEVSATLGAVGNELEILLDTGDASVTGTGVYASAVLTLSGNAVADETVTIGSRVYTWKAALTAANQVMIGATASDSLSNLAAAINGAAGAGTIYGTGTAAHADGGATVGGSALTFTADDVGTSYNTLATTETMSAGSWAAATLAGGRNASTLTGGDGKDNEGTAFPTLFAVDGIRIRCTAGSCGIGSGTILSLPLSAGGVLQIADPGGIAEFMAESLVITAAAMDTAVTVEVIARIAD